LDLASSRVDLPETDRFSEVKRRVIDGLGDVALKFEDEASVPLPPSPRPRLDGYPFSPDVVVDITDDIEFLGIASLVMAERGGTEIGLLCACDDS
jgi:hypothetical protein